MEVLRKSSTRERYEVRCIAYCECLQVGARVFLTALAGNRTLGRIQQVSDPEVAQDCSLLQVASNCRRRH